MKTRFFVLSILLVLGLLAAACGGGAAPTQAPQAPAGQATEAPAAGGVTITAMLDNSSALGQQIDKAAAEEFTKQTGINVKVLDAPTSTTDRLQQYLQFLGAQSSDLDVYMIDVIFPGTLAPHMVDLYQYIPKDVVDQHFPAIVENNTVDGKLIGMPYFTDAGLLYYRTDLLEKYGYTAPPKTWDELEQMAKKIQDGERAAGNKDFWGFVWQGAAYEGLTCDALEWQYSSNGGRIMTPDGKIDFEEPGAIDAFNRAKGWVGTISPPGVTTYQEEDARGVWQAGNAAFMRNWPYAWSLGNGADSPIKGKFDGTVLPTGDTKHAATLGGWQLSVSKYSKHPKEAAQFVQFLTSSAHEKQRAIEGSYLPTINALYQDPDVLKAQPFMGKLLDVFTSAVARPSTPTSDKYNQISSIYFTGVNQILTGAAQADAEVQDMASAIEKVMKQ
jgi:trehalose/maltose transport system substrate-binding protein